jgi:fibronectin type 3 domain-containing protein
MILGPVEMAMAGRGPADRVECILERGDDPGARFFRVAAVKDGKEGPLSPVARRQPRFPIDTAASARPDRSVEVEWSKSESADVLAYNVYAATMKVGKDVHPSSMTQFTDFVRLNDKPIAGTSFVDKRELVAAEGLFNHEVRAYQVRAVNLAGVESGPSPLALTLTSSVPSVTATERPDGSTLIEWKPVPEKHIRGYAVYRMDEYRHTACIRLNPTPIAGTNYVDRPEVPKAERRRYYVVAVDALDQEGLPSTGAWSFGRP